MAGADTYTMPPPALVDAPVTPSFRIDPTRTWAVMVTQPALPPIEEIAREEIKLGGIRFEPKMFTESKLTFGLGIAFRRVLAADDTASMTPSRNILRRIRNPR